MSQVVDPTAFRRLLGERCLSAEDVRRRIGLSPTTMARLNRGEPISDSVFRRIVLELQRHPVVSLAPELLSAGQEPSSRQAPVLLAANGGGDVAKASAPSAGQLVGTNASPRN
jgi:hypothetical protein